MIRLEWTASSLRDVEKIEQHYFSRNPVAAEKLLDKIYYTPDLLRSYPNIGRQGRIDGTWEWVISGTKYILVYRIETECISILRVIHGAQNYPDDFKEDIL